MTKLIMLKGLQASGKSTWAKDQVAANSGKIKRVNKDDLRAMIDNGKWSKENESMIIAARDALVITFLEEGLDVIVDDTNFNPKMERGLRKIAQRCFAEFEVKEFDVDIETCILRDVARGRNGLPWVGEDVIRKTYKDKKRWAGAKITVDETLLPDFVIWDDDLDSAIIVDIDGTLAEMGDRSPYDFSKVHLDTPHQHIVDLVNDIYWSGKYVIIFSGRDDSCEFETHKWLTGHGIPYHEVHMRQTGDKRNDALVKKEMFDEFVRGQYNVEFVLDDRDQVVRMWRKVLGLPCLQVAEGNF